MEISAYVGDHSNWRLPIIPEEGECCQLDFQPDRFDWAGNYWVCPSQGM
jgi:hypothetical protein